MNTFRPTPGLTEADAQALFGRAPVAALLALPCDSAQSVIYPSVNVAVLSSTLRLAEGRSLSVRYLVDAVQASATADLSELDLSDYRFSIECS